MIARRSAGLEGRIERRTVILHSRLLAWIAAFWIGSALPDHPPSLYHVPDRARVPDVRGRVRSEQ